jgi:hypothetical protein
MSKINWFLAHLIFNIDFWLHLVRKKEKAARNFVEEREHDFYFFWCLFLFYFLLEFFFGSGSARGRQSIFERHFKNCSASLVGDIYLGSWGLRSGESVL